MEYWMIGSVVKKIVGSKNERTVEHSNEQWEFALKLLPDLAAKRFHFGCNFIFADEWLESQVVYSDFFHVIACGYPIDRQLLWRRKAPARDAARPPA